MLHIIAYFRRGIECKDFIQQFAGFLQGGILDDLLHPGNPRGFMLSHPVQGQEESARRGVPRHLAAHRHADAVSVPAAVICAMSLNTAG